MSTIGTLDDLVEGPLENVVALMLWKQRHRNQNMAVVIREDDIRGLEDCCAYLKLNPEVVVVRPEGRAATPAVPPRGNRPGIPAQPAESPRSHVVVALVNKGTMDAIRPLENNDGDASKLVQSRHRQHMQGKARFLAQAAMRMSSSGDVSTSELRDIAECLEAFGVEDDA